MLCWISNVSFFYYTEVISSHYLGNFNFITKKLKKLKYYKYNIQCKVFILQSISFVVSLAQALYSSLIVYFL